MVLKNLFLVMLFCVTGSALAAELVSVEAAHIRGMPPGQQTTTAYMQLTNNTRQVLHLRGAVADWSERIEVHSHSMKDGVMRMRKVDALTIGPADTVSLEPGGYHLMVFGLQRVLKDGEKLDLILQFDSGTQRVQIPVKSILSKSDSHHHHHH